MLIIYDPSVALTFSPESHRFMDTINCVRQEDIPRNYLLHELHMERTEVFWRVCSNIIRTLKIAVINADGSTLFDYCLIVPINKVQESHSLLIV